MTDEQRQTAQTLADTARKLTLEERERFLRDNTGADRGLLYEVRSLLAGAETVAISDLDETIAMAPGGGPAFIEDSDATVVISGTESAARSGAREAPTSVEGRRIGNFRVVRLLAQGGMGEVYAAMQITEDFERMVALKVVKPELSRAEIMRRFRMERQLLANLDHPNIARLLDAGATDDGIPYLAMEYVEGLPIDKYCEVRKLSVEERLKLFVTVCDAVQYAHRHLIVHRDIKPSNILVTEQGEAKLLDFGIAKLLDAETGAEKIHLTGTGVRPMTPAYASPEQVRGDTVTTSSDIYSLGVLLYELLTGSLPYQFKSFSAIEIERTVCESEPARPSAVELTASPEAPEMSERTRKRLRGDLDMIVLMALRKEPMRRYASVQQFAEDIRLHLNGFPVIAQSDTVRYRVRKFVSRHTTGVLAATLAVISLIVATIVSVHFARVARQEQAIAERRFMETRDLARFFVMDLDDAIRAGETTARKSLVTKGLDYLKRLSTEAAGDPGLQHEVVSGYIKMGDVQGNPFGQNLGDHIGAESSYTLALDNGRRFARDSQGDAALKKDVAAARIKLADLKVWGGNPSEALETYREVAPQLEGLDRAETIRKLGFVANQLGDYRTAIESLQQARDLARPLIAADPKNLAPKTTFALASQRLGEALASTGEYVQAIEHVTTALRVYEEMSAADPSSTQTRRRIWASSMILGDVLKKATRLKEAEIRYRAVARMTDSLMQADPENRQYQKDYIATLSRLADLLAAQPARSAEVRALTEKALQTLQPLVARPDAGDYEIQQYVWLLLTTPFDDLRSPAKALPFAEKAVRKTVERDPRVLDMLALAQFGVGKTEQAIETELKALALLPKDSDSALRRELEANLRKFRASALRASPPTTKGR